MPFVTAAGVQVNFPFEPYPCQIDYMEKVITCLREGYNGILESPTGTGKTLCLLCSSLAWLEDKKAQIHSQKWKLAQTDSSNGVLDQFKEQLAQQLDDAAGAWSGEFAAPKIIYASRTHSQLSQAVQELKRTAYSHFKVCVLGSREQLCIHPVVMREESNNTKVHLCRAKVSARDCYFYNSVENAKPHFVNTVMDIEDLVQLGEKHKCCPYYMARELKTEADIIFMPYNYLLDPKSRKAHGVELQGNIIIFDEAHNLEKICEDSASFDLSSGDIAAAIRDINELSEKLQHLYGSEASSFDVTGGMEGAAQDFTLEEVLQLKAQILHLEEEIDGIQLARQDQGITKPGSFIFEILSKVNLTFETKTAVLDLMDKIVSFLANDSSSSVFSSKGNGLSKFADIVKIVFSHPPAEYTNLTSHQQAVSKHYKVHIQEEVKKSFAKKSDGWGATSATAPAAQKTTRTLSYWCFSPGHAMGDLKAHGVKSIILTSGTLSPLNSFKLEMGIDFQVELENPHVIEKHQVWLGIIGKGPDSVLLSSTYENRFKDEYQASLGNAVVNFSRVVPHGLLLFFPSYPVMNKCLENWQRGNIWNRVEQYKPIFVEPRVKAEFNTAIFNYYDKINNPCANGAVFAAVCRGKVSEGLDFSDNNGRAVVITGLPFPPRMDPKVMLKMQFLDEARRQEGKGLTGQEWYRQQASRAVNQAIGRVIRHKNDYGAIILCDNRFNQPSATAQLPIWIRPHVKKYTSFGLAIKDLMMFFKRAQQTMPQDQSRSKSRCQTAKVGCQGAYFQQAVSKQASQKISNVNKSSSVSTHVPSLKQSHEHGSSAVSLDVLKQQYRGCSSKYTTQRFPAPGHGLLTALQTNEVKLSEDNNEVQASSTQSTMTSTLLDQKIKTKRKIMIKKADYTSLKKDSLQTAEQFVAEVRDALSVESYKFFSKALSDYKKTGDYTTMVAALADIFTDHKNKYHLFRKFYRFVRPQHKQQFDETCKELIGESCGFKPEHALVKKRSVPKKSTNISCSELLSSCNATHLNITTHMNKDSLTKVPTIIEDSNQTDTKPGGSATDGKSCDTDGVFTSTVTRNVSGSEPPAAGVQPNIITNQSVNSESGTSNYVDISGGHASSSCSSNKEIGVNDTVDWDRINWNSLSSTIYPPNIRRITGYICTYCKKEASVPLTAPCKHLCCLNCWKICIRPYQFEPEGTLQGEDDFDCFEEGGIIMKVKLSSVQNVIKQFAERILRRYFSYLDPIDEVSDRPGLVLASLSVLETARKTVIVFL
ncbi:hypothetical protein LSH36_457g01025 [Paralvinella palmiformis]|uniref:Regulator of telomere elongation helicase 1 homolog n=1 Tax=Paralvinella palmiformis TaxID=53620 RepID=A0AAD9JAM7_9ANNE|nr:hypothetical protein LSH36_457g01025 [Paralvinella palmiformis]